MSVPITLSCTSYTKAAIEASGKNAVALVTQMGQTVAILRDPEIYAHRKEEIVTRMFGVIDPDHPYIRHIYSGGDYLIGGEIELLDRIRYNDGLDKVRNRVCFYFCVKCILATSIYKEDCVLTHNTHVLKILAVEKDSEGTVGRV
jgi:hypothetical protein